MAGVLPPPLAAIAGSHLFGNDPVMADLLYEADRLPDTSFGIVDFSNASVPYINSRFGEWTGLSPAELMAGGMRRLISLVKPSQLIHLALHHGAFIQHARSEDFDPRAVRYLDLSWTAVTPKGALPLLSTAVVLTYTVKAQFGTTVAFVAKEQDGSLDVMVACRRLLKMIKERHNSFHQHVPVQRGGNPLPMQLINPVLEKVTEREIDVLKLLAQGFSTTEIATQLGITANTVETHRKKLLEKFEAKNVAELIKKASRVYWLE